MHRIILILAALSFAATVQAQSSAAAPPPATAAPLAASLPSAPMPAPAPQWQSIASARPGTPLLLFPAETQSAIRCTLVWIDADALACDDASIRTVYPLTSLRSAHIETQTLFTTPPQTHPHTGRLAAMLIGLGAGASILGGIGAANGLSVGQGFALATVGAFIGGSFVAIVQRAMDGPDPYAIHCSPFFGCR